MFIDIYYEFFVIDNSCLHYQCIHRSELVHQMEGSTYFYFKMWHEIEWKHYCMKYLIGNAAFQDNDQLLIGVFWSSSNHVQIK